MLHFLLGRPGSGKTHDILEKIRSHAERVSDGDFSERVFLIVPEQQVYSAERRVLSSLPPNAARWLSVVSFTRLCDLAENAYGGRTAAHLNRSTRSLLMWHTLRELSGIMETYGQSGRGTDTSLCDLMLGMTEELSQNGISPQRLEAAIEGMDHDAPLYRKLRDIALVSAAYGNLVGEICGDDPADRLLRAATKMEQNRFFANKTVYLDSFTSFTAQEYAVLRAILRDADDVTVSLCTDARRSRQPQFESVNDTANRLVKLGESLGKAWTDTPLDPSNRQASPELLALDASLWDFSLSKAELPVVSEEVRGAVTLHVAPNAYEEAEAAALHILELHESGIPYGEIAVVVRDANAWRGILDAALEQYDIPFFLSERTDLHTKPAARLLVTALRCISRGWQSGDVISLCKTGLCGISPREMDMFSEYVETWRIRGKRMEESWSMNPDGYAVERSARADEILRAANRVRETVMTPLMALKIKLKAAKDVAAQCRALYDYLCDLSVREQLAAEAETHLKLGNTREAGEAVRLWSFLTEALAAPATVLPADCEPLTTDELSAALTLIFASTDIGSVPTRHDCVTVGSADMLRVDDIRASLLLGLNEGEFPRAVTDGGLLSEQDKDTLETLGIKFDSRASRRNADELLYVWRAMTKPSERLILSYSTATNDGKKRSPSAAISRIRYLMPYLAPQPFSSSYVREGGSARFRAPDRDTVSKPRIHALLGESIRLNQTKLQAFAKCPYKYYSEYVLDLRERADAQLSTLSSGTFLHHVLEHFIKEALDENHRFRQLTRQETVELTDRIIREYIRKLCGDDAEGNGRILHVFSRMREVILVLIDSIQAELHQSEFSILATELDTRLGREGEASPLVLPLVPTPANEDEAILPALGVQEDLQDVRLVLGGIVDRVDVYRSEDGRRVYVRVVDYKSSPHTISQAEIEQKMNIQLLLYLFTLCAPRNRALFADKDGRIPDVVLPAEAMYMSVDESDKGGALTPCRSGVILQDDEVLRAASATLDPAFLPSVYTDKKGDLKGSGLCPPDLLATLEASMHSVIRDTATAMYNGIAHRRPSSDSCRYCRVKDSCSLAVRSDF